VRLDDYLVQHRLTGLGLIKLDVERHERAVLRGMGEVLDRSRPTTITEVLPKPRDQGAVFALRCGVEGGGLYRLARFKMNRKYMLAQPISWPETSAYKSSGPSVQAARPA
jgi:hypothetical protein